MRSKSTSKIVLCPKEKKKKPVITLFPNDRKEGLVDVKPVARIWHFWRGSLIRQKWGYPSHLWGSPRPTKSVENSPLTPSKTTELYIQLLILQFLNQLFFLKEFKEYNRPKPTNRRLVSTPSRSRSVWTFIKSTIVGLVEKLTLTDHCTPLKLINVLLHSVRFD